MSIAQLARMNGISTNAMLHPGQRLQISGSPASSGALAVANGDPPVSGHVSYTVKKGDTLSDIALRFEVTVQQLQGWNNMGPSTSLRAGQRLAIHVGNNTNVGG